MFLSLRCHCLCLLIILINAWSVLDIVEGGAKTEQKEAKKHF